MPRFFFDFRQGAELSADADGIEFPDAENAYLEAFKAAQEMWSELLAERQDPRRCVFEIRDDEGRQLFILPFTEVVEICDNNAYEPRKHGEVVDQIRLSHDHATILRNEITHQISAAKDKLGAIAAMIAQVF